MYPVAVLAGGRGTRIARVSKGLPKILLPVAGRPFLDFKLASLAEQGVERVVLLLGHGSEQVLARLGEGPTFGLEVIPSVDGPSLLGTGGALRRALPYLGDRFWVTYGDSYLRAPMAAAECVFERGRFAGLMTVLRNCDAWDRSNVRVDNGLVAEYVKGAPAGTYEYIDYGLLILTAAAFRGVPDGASFGLEDVLRPLVMGGRLVAFEVTERFYEIGTPESYEETGRFLQAEALPVVRKGRR
jgi:MurNAc alpha-1-phosphate uridylyltransferase